MSESKVTGSCSLHESYMAGCALCEMTPQQRLLTLVTDQPDLVREAAHSGFGPRAEHMAWLKERALEELTTNGPTKALASVMSDLRKHPETEDHVAMVLGMMLAMNGHLETDAQMRDWIDGLQ